ncbi:hypothetical protein Tco_0030712 [Tanacetum coccineum]
MDVNNGSVEHDKNVHASYELEQLAKNSYKEAEKEQIIGNKNHSEDVKVFTRTNKKTNVASKKNVVQIKKNVTNVDVKNALKAKDVLCVSCDKNVLTPCHDKGFAKFKLNVNLNVKRAIFTTPRTMKSKSLDTTPVVTKTRFAVVFPLSGEYKVPSASSSTSLFSQAISLGKYMRTKIKTSMMWQKCRTNVVIQIVLWIVDSGCSKHMTGDLKLLKTFVEKLMDTPSSSSINVEDNEAPPLVSSSKEQISPILNDKADEFIQEEYYENLDRNTLLSPYHTPMFEEAKSSSTAKDPSNLKVITLVQPSIHVWTKAHPLDQVIGDPSRLVMRRSRLVTDSELCMYTLTISTTKQKNIKEAMADHSWIESMQDELYQFQRLDVWELVPRPTDRNVIEEEGIDFEESFAPVDRLEAAMMFVKESFVRYQATSKSMGTPTNQMKYHSMIGGLMYLIAIRPDIAFATFVCVRYQARPTVKYFKEVKRIFRCLRQSYNMGLWYSKDYGFELIAYLDADHAGCHDD